MSARKVVFWMHLVAGVVAGAVVLVMSVTGVLLAYERQMTAWADAAPTVEVFRGTPRLSPEALLEKVREARPQGIPGNLILKSDPSLPAIVGLGREGVFFANPYTGEIVGEGSKAARTFFHEVTDWHRWLGTHGENRVWGKGITGACNLAFLFLVVSGIYLWWPRPWSQKNFQSVGIPRIDLEGKARDWNWHNSIGFWLAPILFFIVLTGVLISYPWATRLLYQLTGNEAPPAREGGGEMAGRVTKVQGWTTGTLDPLWVRAEQQGADWKSISVRFPNAPGKSLTFLIDQGDGSRPDMKSSLTLDSKSGEILRWEPYESFNAGRKARFWARWIHTGEAGGIAGQTLAMLASGGASLLVYTGFSLSVRRLFKFIQGKK